ncbi:hypothetical protein PhaeoP23_03964 (plasmid) [Phaeobacter piscinae]|uniref:DUF3644 domain-containing protein n=1 Tax=Phaeobacter piscinae TaxID=1580596 RepID=A0ABM6PJV7_9RHOB|nr:MULTISPECIES: DUF3644 domain-containing protein [Phaeobacter]ATG38117.1 hypothetical protein PhaeoP36_04042 [Phaeobacter piscinae]AUQ88638.1 hypothetical protein PhaeoP42_04043 [Phaeobacter piscinae]AUQ92637.1 hypothetical protein PhaeoP24_04079 [Phaeobacter inhibens]AUR26443.1 hypothetical protein PhaeoP23_03964 [Phaeobacter piscinae]
MTDSSEFPIEDSIPTPKPKRKRGNGLERWEIAIIKAMFARGGFNDQHVQAYFTRPTRTVNHRAFGEIRTGAKHKSAKAASEEVLDAFLAAWPDVDPDTGLSRSGDELLIKAREAMIAAVHTFNGAGLTFRAELFIVTCVIAWTYLLHAWFKREGIDYRYSDKTKQGADKYWELGKCLKHDKSPVSAGAKKNLEFLLEIRHEIEHRSTSRIDDAIGGELQASCINFNEALKSMFGPQYGLEKRLPIALQFVSFGDDQRTRLKQAADLPPHVATFINAFEHGLSDEELANPAFRYRVAFVPITSNRASGADRAIEFVKHGSADAEAVNQVLLKEVNKPRHTATEVAKRVQAKGYPHFKENPHHRNLVKQLGAKNPAKGYGCKGDYEGHWVWFDHWIDRVVEHCKENGEKYTSA